MKKLKYVSNPTFEFVPMAYDTFGFIRQRLQTPKSTILYNSLYTSLIPNTREGKEKKFQGIQPKKPSE